MMNINKMNVYTCVFLVTCAVSSAFSVPREVKPILRVGRPVVCMAYEIVLYAQHKTELKQRLQPLVDEDVMNSSGDVLKQKLDKLQQSVLEGMRDTLTVEEKRELLVLCFEDFLNPSGHNIPYGTRHYAMMLDAFVATNNRSNAELVAFEKVHRPFCQVFKAQANASLLSLVRNLQCAFDQVRDNNTQAMIKPIIARVGLSKLWVLKKRIANNSN